MTLVCARLVQTVTSVISLVFKTRLRLRGSQGHADGGGKCQWQWVKRDEG